MVRVKRGNFCPLTSDSTLSAARSRASCSFYFPNPASTCRRSATTAIRDSVFM
jgi:hypothetical protein